MIPIRFGRAAVFLACFQGTSHSRRSGTRGLRPALQCHRDGGVSWTAARRPGIQEADDDESTARQPHDGPPAPADPLLRAGPPAWGEEAGRHACPRPAPLPLPLRGLRRADDPPRRRPPLLRSEDGRPRRTPRVEQPPQPRGVLGCAAQRLRPPYAELPALGPGPHLHHQPRRGLGDLRRRERVARAGGDSRQAAERAPGRDHAGHPDAEVPPGLDEYEALLATATPVTRRPPLARNDAAGLCYTSGTTGSPEGLGYTHPAMVLH